MDDPRSDEELIAAYEDGEDSAFEIIYRRHRDWVVRLAHRFCRHEDDALDVLQETFSYFLRKFPGFELRARLTTFLYPVVRNLSFDANKRRRRHAAGGAEIALEAEAPPQPVAGVREELARAMAQLSENHREVVLMRYVDDLTLEEISLALEVPTGTVKSRLHHALAKLEQSPGMRRYFEKL